MPWISTSKVQAFDGPGEPSMEVDMSAPGTHTPHADESRADPISRPFGGSRSSAPVRWMNNPSTTTLEAAARTTAAPETPEGSAKAEEGGAVRTTESQPAEETETLSESAKPPRPAKGASGKKKPKRTLKAKPAADAARRAPKKR